MGTADGHFGPEKLLMAGVHEVSHVGHHVWEGKNLAWEVSHVQGPINGASHLVTPGVESTGLG